MVSKAFAYIFQVKLGSERISRPSLRHVILYEREQNKN